MSATLITSKNPSPRTQPVGKCPLCNSPASSEYFTAPDRLHGVSGWFTYRRCRDCRTVFQDPRVIADDLAVCYPANYFTHIAQESSGKKLEIDVLNGESDEPSVLRELRDQIRELIKRRVQGKPVTQKSWGVLASLFARSARLRERAFYNIVPDDLLPKKTEMTKALEIGCGAGQTLVKLLQVGWEVEGVEWDAQAARLARQISGQTVWEGDFRTVNLPLREYGLVYLHHVFEHIDNSRDALRRIYDLLAPGGRAVIIYPNPNSLGAKIYGDAWFPWEVPRHLVIPPAKAVMNIAEQLGFYPMRLSVSAKDAAYFFALSRTYSLGKPVNESQPDIRARDTLLAIGENLLIKLFPSLGEEISLVLVKK